MEESNQSGGRVDFERGLDFRSRGQVLRDFVIAILLVVGFVVLVVWVNWPEVAPLCIALLAFGAYCTVAYFVRVRPDHEVLGIDGAAFDPLRNSSNRFLMRLTVALSLGRYISLGLADGIRLLTSGKLPQDQFIEGMK